VCFAFRFQALFRTFLIAFRAFSVQFSLLFHTGNWKCTPTHTWGAHQRSHTRTGLHTHTLAHIQQILHFLFGLEDTQIPAANVAFSPGIFRNYLLRVFHVFHAISSLFASLFSPFSRFPHTALIAFPLFLRFSLPFDDNSLIFADVFSLDSLAFATHHFSRAFNRIFQAFPMRVWLKFSKINSWFCCCRRARYVHISIDRYR